MEEGIEVIEFKRPQETNKKLFIPNLCESSADKPCVQEQLREAFGTYGLLYDVSVIPADDSSNVTPLPSANDDVYAFVTFYSYRDAMNAKRSLTGSLFINGRLATIKFSRPRNNVGSVQSLYIAKCYDLANHFLGFNGWTSNILSLKPEVDENEAQSCHVTVRCVVQIRVSTDNLHSEGAAIAQQFYSKAGAADKGVAMCKAKKQAYQLAMQDAFRKIVIVRLSDGRIHVEVNTTVEEQLHFDEELCKDSLLKVNECTETPLVDSDNDVTEEIDDMNMQILRDLENDNFEDDG